MTNLKITMCKNSLYNDNGLQTVQTKYLVMQSPIALLLVYYFKIEKSSEKSTVW